MIIDVKAKGQIALPKEVVKSLKIAKGDRLELVVENGIITLVPVVVTPKVVVKELKDAVTKAKKNVGNGEAFVKVDEVIEKL